jgi:hypothetical protein
MRMSKPNVLSLTADEASDGPDYDANEAGNTVERWIIYL